jgi:hypothetical protein
MNHPELPQWPDPFLNMSANIKGGQWIANI